MLGGSNIGKQLVRVAHEEGSTATATDKAERSADTEDGSVDVETLD